MVSTSKRCGCRDSDTRKPLGGRCPELRRKDGTWDATHGTWYGKAELPPGPGGKRADLRCGGFGTKKELLTWFDEALQLIKIPGTGPAAFGDRAEIAALVRKCRQQHEDLPEIDDIRRRFAASAAYEAGTTGEYLLQWLADREREESLRRRTLRSYSGHIRRNYLPVIGEVPIDRLRAHHVRAVFDKIDEENARLIEARESPDPEVRRSVAGRRPTSSATKQRIRATLRSALSDAMRPEVALVTINAAAQVRLAAGKRPKARLWTRPRVEAWEKGYRERLGKLGAKASPRERLLAWQYLPARPSPVMVWMPEQIGRFLDETAEHRLYPMFHLIALRGLRRGEACGLCWQDVDFEARTITIRTQLVVTDYEVDEDDPKTDSSDEYVPLDDEACAVLTAWKETQDAEREALGGAWRGTAGRVFTTEDGSDWHPNRVYDIFLILACQAGLPPIRIHDLRHGAAAIALAAGAVIKEVQQLLRHASSAITSDIYATLLPELENALASRMSQLVPRKRRVEVPEAAGPTSVPRAVRSERRTAS